LSGKNLVGKSSDFEVYSFVNWEPMQVG